MQIEYRTGDLLSAPELVVVQGCNAQGAMNSGVAKLIRERCPKVFDEYSRVHKSEGLAMGQVIWVEESTRRVYANAITQQFYGREPNHRYASYDAIALAFEEINHIMGEMRVAMPLIGAGLAQGDWQIISRIIERECREVQPVVYLLDGIIPK
jgi:O-acetyl-ADP-ribose deacetylase (regulator of RNase III)